jgi:sugar (pentulose or hexulose) kinase
VTRDLLVGLDIGTTSCKAAIVTPEGAEVSHGKRQTPWVEVPTGAEIDARALAEAAVGAALDAIGSMPNGRVASIGVASMGETGVLLDHRGDPLAPGIAWHDTRGGEEARGIAETIGASEFARRTGLPVGPFWSIAKYVALRRARPELSGGRRWLSVAEWLVRYLGGEEVAELSLASRTGLLEISSRRWWDDALAWAEIQPSVMPPLVQAGTPAGVVGRVPAFRGAVLTVAGHDHPTACAGAGAGRSGDVLDSCGTAEALVRGVPFPLSPETMLAATEQGITAGFHVLPDQQALLGFFKAGFAFKRFLALLGCEEAGQQREALDRAAVENSTTMQVSGLTEDAATVAGIGFAPSPGALWRAVLETAAGETARILSSIEGLSGPRGRVVVTGGWARSEALRSIKQEVLGPFEYPNVAEAGARGAALFGGLAAGVYGGVDDFPPPISKTGLH